MTRAKSGAYSVRKAIPADVRDEYERPYGQRWEATLTLPATMRPQEAKAAQAKFLATVETRIKAIRDANAGRTRSLNERGALALAGEWYRWYTAQHEDNPGSPKHWEDLSEALYETVSRAHWEGEDGQYAINHKEWPDCRQAIAQESGADRFLADKGLALTPEAWDLFLQRVAFEFLTAAHLLERRGNRDYSPDKRLHEFPEWTEKTPKPHKVTGLTPWTLFEAYQKDKEPAPATVNRWRAVFLDLEKHFEGRAASSISGEYSTKRS
jgi:hypothetical protein